MAATGHLKLSSHAIKDSKDSLAVSRPSRSAYHASQESYSNWEVANMSVADSGLCYLWCTGVACPKKEALACIQKLAKSAERKRLQLEDGFIGQGSSRQPLGAYDLADAGLSREHVFTIAKMLAEAVQRSQDQPLPLGGPAKQLVELCQQLEGYVAQCAARLPDLVAASSKTKLSQSERDLDAHARVWISKMRDMLESAHKTYPGSLPLLLLGCLVYGDLITVVTALLADTTFVHIVQRGALYLEVFLLLRALARCREVCPLLQRAPHSMLRQSAWEALSRRTEEANALEGQLQGAARKVAQKLQNAYISVRAKLQRVAAATGTAPPPLSSEPSSTASSACNTPRPSTPPHKLNPTLSQHNPLEPARDPSFTSDPPARRTPSLTQPVSRLPFQPSPFADNPPAVLDIYPQDSTQSYATAFTSASDSMNLQSLASDSLSPLPTPRDSDPSPPTIPPPSTHTPSLTSYLTSKTAASGAKPSITDRQTQQESADSDDSTTTTRPQLVLFAPTPQLPNGVLSLSKRSTPSTSPTLEPPPSTYRDVDPSPSPPPAVCTPPQLNPAPKTLSLTSRTASPQPILLRTPADPAHASPTIMLSTPTPFATTPQLELKSRSSTPSLSNLQTPKTQSNDFSTSHFAQSNAATQHQLPQPTALTASSTTLQLQLQRAATAAPAIGATPPAPLPQRQLRGSSSFHTSSISSSRPQQQAWPQLQLPQQQQQRRSSNNGDVWQGQALSGLHPLLEQESSLLSNLSAESSTLSMTDYSHLAAFDPASNPGLLRLPTSAPGQPQGGNPPPSYFTTQPTPRQQKQPTPRQQQLFSQPNPLPTDTPRIFRSSGGGSSRTHSASEQLPASSAAHPDTYFDTQPRTHFDPHDFPTAYRATDPAPHTMRTSSSHHMSDSFHDSINASAHYHQISQQQQPLHQDFPPQSSAHHIAFHQAGPLRISSSSSPPEVWDSEPAAAAQYNSRLEPARRSQQQWQWPEQREQREQREHGPPPPPDPDVTFNPLYARTSSTRQSDNAPSATSTSQRTTAPSTSQPPHQPNHYRAADPLATFKTSSQSNSPTSAQPQPHNPLKFSPMSAALQQPQPSQPPSSHPYSTASSSSGSISPPQYHKPVPTTHQPPHHSTMAPARSQPRTRSDSFPDKISAVRYPSDLSYTPSAGHPPPLLPPAYLPAAYTDYSQDPYPASAPYSQPAPAYSMPNPHTNTIPTYYQPPSSTPFTHPLPSATPLPDFDTYLDTQPPKSSTSSPDSSLKAPSRTNSRTQSRFSRTSNSGSLSTDPTSPLQRALSDALQQVVPHLPPSPRTHLPPSSTAMPHCPPHWHPVDPPSVPAPSIGLWDDPALDHQPSNSPHHHPYPHTQHPPTSSPAHSHSRTSPPLRPTLNPYADDTARGDTTRQLSLSHAAEQVGVDLVGAEAPVSGLVEKYQGSNMLVAAKMISLESVFPKFRRVVGDGNCFYRAFLFALLEHIVVAMDVALCDRLQEILPRLMRHAEQVLPSLHPEARRGYDVIGDMLLRMWFRGGEDPVDLAALERLLNTRSTFDALVRLARAFTAAELRSREEHYAPFLAGSDADRQGMSLQDICDRFVERMDMEVEQVQVAALVTALGIPVGILDVAHSDTAYLKLPQKAPPPAFWLLHTPGHYDIVYPAKASDVIEGTLVPLEG